MKIIKEELRFEESLKKRLEFICEFSNVTPTFINGSIRKIDKTNISYIEPHRVIVKDTTFLVFNYSNDVYYRLLKSQVKEPVIEEMKEKNKEHYLMDKLEFVKNPLIAEFLGFSLEDNYTETELETSIINNLQKFLMELRKRLCICRKTTTYSHRKR